MSNRTYDILKYIALFVLPASASLCITLGQVWGFQYSEQIALTITALDTFLGALLGISSAKYNKANN